MTECYEHTNRTCLECKLEKNILTFPKSARSKDGFNLRCKTCINLINKKWRTGSRDKYLKSRIKSYYKNIDKSRLEKREYYKKHKLQKSEYDKEYRDLNRSKIKQYKKLWEFANKDNPIFKIKRNLRRRIHHVLKNNSKSKHTFELIGCNAIEFKAHIESLWTNGMNWSNYGPKGWHIDHIIPCHKFDLSRPEEQRKCFHYSNQRPLWAKDNLARSRN